VVFDGIFGQMFSLTPVCWIVHHITLTLSLTLFEQNICLKISIMFDIHSQILVCDFVFVNCTVVYFLWQRPRALIAVPKINLVTSSMIS